MEPDAARTTWSLQTQHSRLGMVSAQPDRFHVGLHVRVLGDLARRAGCGRSEWSRVVRVFPARRAPALDLLQHLGDNGDGEHRRQRRSRRQGRLSPRAPDSFDRARRAVLARNRVGSAFDRARFLRKRGARLDSFDHRHVGIAVVVCHRIRSGARGRQRVLPRSVVSVGNRCPGVVFRNAGGVSAQPCRGPVF